MQTTLFGAKVKKIQQKTGQQVLACSDKGVSLSDPHSTTVHPEASTENSDNLQNEALVRVQRTRRAIQKLNSELLTLNSIDKLAVRLLEGLSVLIGADSGSVMLVDDTRQFLNILADVGLPPQTQRQNIPLDASVSGIVLFVGEPLLLRGHMRDQSPKQRDVKCSIVVPIQRRGEFIGTVNLNRDLRKSAFNEDDLEIVTSTAATFSAMFDALQNQEESHRVILSTVKALALTIEAKDPYTRGHCDRVRMHARGIGKLLELDSEFINQMEMGATLHDIGKIGIPEHILLKPGNLTDEEYAHIKRHPQLGVDIIHPVNLPQVTIEAVLHHHERYDGGGYPYGLKGESIPLAARILCVLDAFDAMTITRPYRNALEVDVAFQELLDCANSQFDPKLVITFLEYYQREQFHEKLTSLESARTKYRTPKTKACNAEEERSEIPILANAINGKF